MRWLCVLSLLLIVCPAPGWAAQPCWRETLQSLFRVEAQSGQRLTQKQVKSILPSEVQSDHVWLLSKGGEGGEVYRVQFGSESKIMKRVDLMTALNDEVGFHLLREASVGQKDVQIVTSKLLPVDADAPQSLLRTRSWLELQDVKGQSLFSVLNDPTIPAQVRTTLLEKYDSFLNHVEKNLKTKRKIVSDRLDVHPKYFPAEIPDESLPTEAWKQIKGQPKILKASMPIWKLSDEMEPLYRTLEKTSGGRIILMFEAEKDIQLILKSDNFLVTPEYDLYLIDPY